MTDKSELIRVPEQSKLPGCMLCGVSLSIRPSRGRKSGKPFILVICPVDGKHFRAFIADQHYVEQVMDRVEKRGLQDMGTTS